MDLTGDRMPASISLGDLSSMPASLLSRLLSSAENRNDLCTRMAHPLGLVANVLAVQAESAEALARGLSGFAALEQALVQHCANHTLPGDAREKASFVFEFLNGNGGTAFKRGYLSMAEGIAGWIDGKGPLGDCYNVTLAMYALSHIVGLEMRMHRDLYHVFASVSDDGYVWHPVDFAYGNNVAETAYIFNGRSLQHAETGRPCDTLSVDNIRALFLCRFAMDGNCPSERVRVYYNEALNAYPEWAELYNDVGDLDFFAGDLSRAAVLYAIAVQKEPYNIFYRLNAAICKCLLEPDTHHGALVEEASTLLTIYPDFVEAQLFKALMEESAVWHLKELHQEVHRKDHLMYGQFMAAKLDMLMKHFSVKEVGQSLLLQEGDILKEQVIDNDLYKTGTLKEHSKCPDEYLHVHTLGTDVLPLIEEYVNFMGVRIEETRALVWGYGASVILPRVLIETGLQVSGVEYGGNFKGDHQHSLYDKLEVLFDDRSVETSFPDLLQFDRFSHHDRDSVTFDFVFVVNPNPALWATDATGGVEEWSRWLKPGGIVMLQIDGDYRELGAIANVLYEAILRHESLTVLHEISYDGTDAPFPSLYKNYTGHGNVVLIIRNDDS